jgi:histidinol-phosphate aminotransferase
MRIPDGAGLMLGNGSDELIQLITHALGRPGAVVMAPEPTFAMYRMNAQIANIRFEGVPLNADFTLEPKRFLAKVEALKPALIWIAYPNNPTGNCYPDADIEAIIRAAPGLVVLDEAYNIFAGRTFLHRLAAFPNLVVMRTVSKVGLAGIRLGYAAAAPQWIEQLDKVRPPYNVSVLAQVAGDIALRYAAEFDAQAERIKAARTAMIARLAALSGVQTFPTEANFVLVRVPDAPSLDAHLKQRKILIRNFHGAHPLLTHCLRLTVGTPEENAQLLSAFAEGLRA